MKQLFEMSTLVYAILVLVPTSSMILVTTDTLFAPSDATECVPSSRVEGGGVETGTLTETGIFMPNIICTVTARLVPICLIEL